MTTNLQVFAIKTFARWMRKNKITQEDLLDATQEMVNGLIDADLGGYVVKKRLALHGREKKVLGQERLLQPILVNVGSFYSDLRRMKDRILTEMSLNLYSSWH